MTTPSPEPGGDKPTPISDLFGPVYNELRSLAARQLRGERAAHTLQPTALVNEIFVRLVDKKIVRGDTMAERRQFFAIAARAMRQVLVEHARKQQADKRGGERQRVTLCEEITEAAGSEIDTLELDEALKSLAKVDPRMVAIIELRFFAGLTLVEIAESLELSPRTIDREWQIARMWLARELSLGGP